MKQDEINTLLNSFFISKNELDKRSAFDEFAHSVSSIIVDEFAKNYLMNNPYLSIYLAHTDGSMLVKKIKSFVAFILTAPVDEEYIKRIHSIGFLHHTIKLEPAKVSYGFWAIGEVLNKLAQTNPLVKEHKSFITKLLKFVEHLMNDGYYIKKNALLHDSIGELSSFNAQNELYVGFNIHKLNAKKVQLALADSANIELLDEIQEDHLNCSFGKILQKISDDKQYEYILGTSSSTIHDLHQKWHLEFQSIKKALSNKDKDKAQVHNKNIATLTQELLSILDVNLERNLQDGQVSLISSITSMKKMTKLFYNKNYKELK